MKAAAVLLAALVLLSTAAPVATQDEENAAVAAGATAIPADAVVADVVDEAGRPIAGVGIVVGTLEEIDTARALTAPMARSDAEGLVFAAVGDLRQELAYEPPLFAVFAKRGYATRQAWVLRSGHGQWYPPMANKPARAAADLGRVVLRKGSMVRGVVRGGDGRPLAGVRVVATDCLRRGFFAQRNRSGITVPVESVIGLTDAAGRFEFDGACPEGVGLEFSKPGYYDTAVDFANGKSAVVVDMTPSGYVSGRVVDGDGKPVDGWVVVVAEGESMGREQARERVAEDGSFRVTARHRGRYRVRVFANTRYGEGARHAETAVYDRPTSGIEVEFGTTDEFGPPARLTVKAAKSGQPVAGARAVVLWNDPRRVNPATLEQRFRAAARACDEKGELQVAAPGANQPPTGAFLVKAPGHAPAIRTGVDYDSEKPPDLEFLLDAESVVTGIVIDEVTGEPMAGARVRLQHQDIKGPGAVANGGADDPVTDARGRFRIGDLGAGNYEIAVGSAGRPDSEPVRFKLGKEALQDGLRLVVPRGAVLAGKVFAGWSEKDTKQRLELGEGWKVHLGPAYVNHHHYSYGIINGAHIQYYTPLSMRTEDAVDLAPDGTFRLTGLSAGRFQFNLVAPALGRRSEPLSIAVTPLRVRDADLVRDFDVAEDLPGVIEGHVTIIGQEIAMSRLLVHSVAGAHHQRPLAYDPSSFRCVVEDDGSFAFRAAEGEHTLYVIDAARHTVLYRMGQSCRVSPGGKLQVDLEIPLSRVRVRLTSRGTRPGEPPAARQVVSFIGWQVHHPGVSYGSYFGTYNSGWGTPTMGREEWWFLLPPLPTRFAVWSNLQVVDQQGGHSYGALVVDDITPAVGELRTLDLPLDAPPEVSDPATGPKKAPKKAPKKDAKKDAGKDP